MGFWPTWNRFNVATKRRISILYFKRHLLFCTVKPRLSGFLDYPDSGSQFGHEYFTHVQYTQTDTIRQTDGPLVPMVRLVPIEKHPIPMVLLVNMHLIKGT